jgi:hypothetical protein
MVAGPPCRGCYGYTSRWQVEARPVRSMRGSIVCFQRTIVSTFEGRKCSLCTLYTGVQRLEAWGQRGDCSASRPRPRERQLFGRPYVGSTTIYFLRNIMSDKPTAPPVENAASATVENVATKAAAAPKALPEQNAAFRMMGR